MNILYLIDLLIKNKKLNEFRIVSQQFKDKTLIDISTLWKIIKYVVKIVNLKAKTGAKRQEGYWIVNQ